MSKLTHLIAKINEYKLRYETETYHPELNILLIEIREHLTTISNVQELIKEGKI